MIVIVKDRQSLLDIAIQTSGSVEAVFVLAAKNNISVTETLSIGQELETVDVVSKMTLERMRVQGVSPATDIANDIDTPIQPYGGIGYMAIGIDFVVS